MDVLKRVASRVSGVTLANATGVDAHASAVGHAIVADAVETALAADDGRGRGIGVVLVVLRFLARALGTQLAVLTCTMSVGFVMGVALARSARTEKVAAMKRGLRQLKDAAAKGAGEVSWKEKAQLQRGKSIAKPQEERLQLQEEFKKVFVKHAPLWCKDSSFSRAHWLNRVIDDGWPYVDTGVSKTVKESVEPILRDLLPTWVTWIGFEKFTLGPRAPTISGVRSHHSHSENAIVDVELSWAAKCEIILSIYVFGIRFPITLRGFQLKALVQAALDPLVDVIPCLGAVEVCLMEMPSVLDFGLYLPGGLDLMALPFVHGIVLNIVHQSIEKMLLYPYKLHCPIMPDSGIEMSSTGMMRIRLLDGMGFYKRRNYSKLSRKRGRQSGRFSAMMKTDSYFIKFWTREQRPLTSENRTGDAPSWLGTADAFVLCDRDTPLHFRLIKKGAERISNYGEIQIMCGEIADRGAGPVVLELPFIDPLYYKDECPLEYLSAADGYTYDEIMKRWNDILAWQGEAERVAVGARAKYYKRAVEDMERRANEVRKADKKRVSHPTLRIELEYIDTGAPDDVEEEDEELGMLTVEIKEADNLLRVDNKPPNPMATLTCAKQTYKTNRKIKTSHPKWNERFVFYNVVSDIDTLEIELRGYEKFLGSVEVDVNIVRQNVKMTDRFPLKGVAKGEVLLELQYTPMASKKVLQRVEP